MTQPTIKPGTRFIHAKFMDADRSPLVCKITRRALGEVYYRPDYGQHEDGSEWLGAPYYIHESKLDASISPTSDLAAWHRDQLREQPWKI